MTTTIEKGYNGWSAQTYLQSEKGAPWVFKVTTMKSSRGGLYSSVQELQRSGDGSFESFGLFDPNYRTAYTPELKVKATEKAVTDYHKSIGLTEFAKLFPEAAKINGMAG